MCLCFTSASHDQEWILSSNDARRSCFHIRFNIRDKLFDQIFLYFRACRKWSLAYVKTRLFLWWTGRTEFSITNLSSAPLLSVSAAHFDLKWKLWLVDLLNFTSNSSWLMEPQRLSCAETAGRFINNYRRQFQFYIRNWSKWGLSFIHWFMWQKICLLLMFFLLKSTIRSWKKFE